MSATDFAAKLKEKFGEIISAPTEFRGEVSVNLAEVGRIVDVCTFARKELDFGFLVDITSLDNYGSDPRFTLVYHLYGLKHRCYLRIKTNVGEEKAEAPSVIGVWATADWHEREIFDMMGIRFLGHPDLRRILMWDGYPYHPLRKDFPLAGKPSDVPETAFTRKAPLEGGPFVTVAGAKNCGSREPRSRLPES